MRCRAPLVSRRPRGGYPLENEEGDHMELSCKRTAFLATDMFCAAFVEQIARVPVAS
jgi:hypothetical protein